MTLSLTLRLACFSWWSARLASLQGNEERWRSDGDGTESGSRQLAAVSNLTQVSCLLPACHSHLDELIDDQVY